MKSLLCILLFAAAAFAQSDIYIGGGPSLHADGPNGGLNLTVGICPSGPVDCILTNYAARFNFKLPSAVAYSTNIAERHVLASVLNKGAVYELFTLASVGASKTADAVGFSGAGGGGLAYHPAKYPNWVVSGAVQADYSPVNPGWKPNVYFQVGYVFHTK